jgi:hypothetical protein
MNFLYPLIAFLFFSFSGIFFLLFIYLNISPIAKTIGINVYYLIGLMFIFALYIISGLKGSMIKGFKHASEASQRFDTHQFFNYASRNNLRFFVIYLIKALINILILGAAYFILINQTTLIQIIGAFIVFLIVFIINYLLHFSTIALVLYDGIGAFRAIKASIVIALTNIFYLIGPYILYIITLATFFIPLINLFTLLIFYPVVETYTLEKLKRLDAKVAKVI